MRVRHRGAGCGTRDAPVTLELETESTSQGVHFMRQLRVAWIVSVVLVPMTASQAAPAPTTQDDGTVTVSDEGSPAAGVDIFLYVNQGKQPLGTTNNVGQLPFDPALLTGKVQVTVVVRECPQRTEVVLVSGDTDDACREAEDPSDDPDCSCEEAGAIWWGSSIRVDVSSLTAQGASPSLTSNPWFWAGTAGGAGAVALIATTGGDDASSTTFTPMTPTTTTPPPTMTPTTPPTTGMETILEGSYNCSLTVIDNPSRHPDLLGAILAIFVRQQNDASSVFGDNANFIEVHGPFLNNRQDLRGTGTYAGFATAAEWLATFIPGTGGAAQIVGEYAAGTDGALPGGGAIRWRVTCTKS